MTRIDRSNPGPPVVRLDQGGVPGPVTRRTRDYTDIASLVGLDSQRRVCLDSFPTFHLN